MCKYEGLNYAVICAEQLTFCATAIFAAQRDIFPRKKNFSYLSLWEPQIEQESMTATN
jgi:hypothetical protein